MIKYKKVIKCTDEGWLGKWGASKRSSFIGDKICVGCGKPYCSGESGCDEFCTECWNTENDILEVCCECGCEFHPKDLIDYCGQVKNMWAKARYFVKIVMKI